MGIQKITIDLPSNVLLAINETEQELKSRIKTSLALVLYAQGKVTIGKAAQIAELPRLHFETLLSESKIPISHLEIEDVLGDLEKLS